MNNHDSIMRDILKEKEVMKKLTSPSEFSELEELTSTYEDPKTLATVIYKLVQEKEKTNKLLENINDKYDKIMFALKTNPLTDQTHEPVHQQNQFEVLPEQDQLILKIIDERGQCTAKDIKTMMNYKGLNAACQRLNKLFKEGHLKKVKSGRKVLYLAKS